MISILMPMRNAELYIESCLNSIINQTYNNWELIIVNDHSTDRSEEIVQNINRYESRIKLLQNNGKGIIEALKLAYTNSIGDYITRMDADDIMPPAKLKILKQLILNNPGAVSTGKIKYIGENLRDGYIKYEAWMNQMMENQTHYQQIYRECVIPSPAWMIHRQQFEKIGAFNSNVYPEDYDLTLRMYKAKLPVMASNEVVHIWRDYNERTSRNDPNYAFNTFETLKTKYFIEIDYNPSKTLVLWGGGKKGKNIAKILNQHKINFRWACNNPKKINQSIYDIKMENIQTVFNNNEIFQTIIAVANPEDQVQIKKELINLPNVKPFWFC